MYDIIFLGDKTIHKHSWEKLKTRFPTAKNASTLDQAKNLSITKMFWVVWPDIILEDNFEFDYTVDDWSTEYVHVFKNSTTYDGVCIIPKTADVTNKELQHRFFRNKKEVDIVASQPKPYDIFYIDTYEQYLQAIEKSTQNLFWIIPSTVDVDDNFDFTFTIDHHNQYDRRINHVFLNGKYHDGVILCSKHLKISAREWQFKFIAGKKEHNVIASTPKPYDVVFISYAEPNADENYENLKQKVPNAKRVHGVKGIHQAHIEAAKLCTTPMVWIIDGDAEIVDDFNFDYQVPAWQYNHVHVWRSKNPINGLVYGYGGVKLFPRELTIGMDTSKPDMTTSISDKFVAVKEISNVTGFNTGEFETWKSAFRECCKLSSKVIDRQKDDETERRLKIWCSIGRDKPFGEYALAGARAGMAYGSANKGNIDALKRINDFEWLKEQFDGNL
jgi:hypothetical protein